jgi:lipoprotein-releasing system permease protein
MIWNVNNNIAFTHLSSRKRQTLIASLGVTIGIALYIFSNSIVVGLGNYTENNMFKTIAHLRVYKEMKVSTSIYPEYNDKQYLVSNPKIKKDRNVIHNPKDLAEKIYSFPFVLGVAPQVDVDLFYINGISQINGLASGITVIEADDMFNIQSTMLAGNIRELSSNIDGIVLGRRIADKFNLSIGDNITVLSVRGVSKVLTVIGVFATGNKITDSSKSYINIATAQKLIQETPYSVTDINIQVTNPDSSGFYREQLQPLMDYKVADWKVEHADQLAQSQMMNTMTPLIAYSIMLVAAFGIYNIINMIISNKMNDIAILKATGFKGSDILQIFLMEALVMGLIGTLLGILCGGGLVYLAKGIYIGSPIGYFPIDFEVSIFVSAIIFGLLVSLGAGYFPARKAAKMDPVNIFRA